ncbi:hypothetical protein Q669_01100 [Labrenzia sp. C1B10]|uniref:hypothetical protein n=1 Tax=unclassified Labrenzia TaxID=2648686 RepID=UPI0003B834C4|nr:MULTISPECIES: hypothetical protein [unclassified Labrenzia]ERP98888.1 hypothetical protein Q669_01100 [Labrenzia sp. C1B10]ERS00843.1 hypothetical protein Q675_08545 [Labrenzia sp. C1B70]
MPLVRLCLLLPLLFSSKAFAADHCIDVQAKRGWQQLSLPGGKITGVQYSGGWSVIAGMYKAVGPRGYTGEDARRLGPLYGYKFDQSYAFGEMLVRDQAGRIVPFAEFAALAVNSRDPAGVYAFRINDKDIALPDNAGSIRVCISMR